MGIRHSCYLMGLSMILVGSQLAPQLANAASTDAARIAGDLKVDGIHFSTDGSVQTTATLVGPQGPTGPAGATGLDGAVGATGATGATGPSGVVAFYDVDGTFNNPSANLSTLSFQGPTPTVAVLAGQRVTATITNTIIWSGPSDLLAYGICYETGGVVSQFMSGLAYQRFSTSSQASVTATGSRVFSVAGSYRVGWCGFFYSSWPATLLQTSTQGWVEVTN